MEVSGGDWHNVFDAIVEGRCKDLREMLFQGVSANIGNNSETALVYAASHGMDECVEALLEYGATYEELPIVDAAVPRDPTVLRRFLQMGGDTDADTMRNALSEAAFYGNANTVRTLLAHGADPEKTVQGHSLFDAPEQWDCTPEEREEVLSLLREAIAQKPA